MGLKMSNSIIFDFETLSTNRYNCVVVSLAALKFSEDNFTSGNGYSFNELVESAKLIKFDVNELVEVDTKRLEILKIVEELRGEQNKASDAITKASKEEKSNLIESMRKVKDELKKKEEELEEALRGIQKIATIF